MEYIPDHPVIRNMEAAGTPDGKPERFPLCPVCGQECETAYVSRTDGEPLGCENCLTEQDAWENEKYFA